MIYNFIIFHAAMLHTMNEKIKNVWFFLLENEDNYIIKLLFGSTYIESPYHTLSIRLYKDFSTISTLIPKTRKLKALKCEIAYKASM